MILSKTMVEMDNEIAQELFFEGAVILFLDVPPRTEFGIDYNSWNVGEKFKGVKMIPPGFHFVFYAAVGKSGQSAPRTGFFHYFKRREIVVKKWDAEKEDVVNQDMSDEELNRMRSGGIKGLYLDHILVYIDHILVYIDHIVVYFDHIVVYIDHISVYHEKKME